MARWLPVPGLDGYAVSDCGRVRNSSGRVLEPHVSSSGYLRVRVRGRWWVVHRLVALAFVGPPPPGKPLALHRNSKKWDCRPENIYWGDHADNARDRQVEHYGRARLRAIVAERARVAAVVGRVVDVEAGAADVRRKLAVLDAFERL